MEAKVKFIDPAVIIFINGQRIHQGNLTQEDYEYLVSWSKDYETMFVPIEEKELKQKAKPDGKEKPIGAS